MSSYPPGTTGNEHAIAGPVNEHEEQKECPGDCCEYVPLQPVLGELEALRRLVATPRLGDLQDRTLAEIDKLLQRLAKPDTEDEIDKRELDCEWEGEVLVTYLDRHGNFVWQCPRCGLEHEGFDDGRD